MATAPPAVGGHTGHMFPLEARGMQQADRASHVIVGFNLPVALYLDSDETGGMTLQKNGIRLDFKHMVMPAGRCGMPIQSTGTEIADDDRGNYTFTSVSACIPYDAAWPSRKYWEEAVRLVNEVIIAYRQVKDRPTIATIGPTDLSQGLFIEGPFPDGKTFVTSAGFSGMYVAGDQDGHPFVSSKGFVGSFVLLQPLHGKEVFHQLQEFLDGKQAVSLPHRFLQEARRELRHGDHGFAAVLGGTALEVAVQEFLTHKGWAGGKSGSFAVKFLQDPFAANKSPGFKDADGANFLGVERLYKVRNKMAHEGKPYYVDEGSTTPVSVGPEDVRSLLDAAHACLDWLSKQ